MRGAHNDSRCHSQSTGFDIDVDRLRVRVTSYELGPYATLPVQSGGWAYNLTGSHRQVYVHSHRVNPVVTYILTGSLRRVCPPGLIRLRRASRLMPSPPDPSNGGGPSCPWHSGQRDPPHCVRGAAVAGRSVMGTALTCFVGRGVTFAWPAVPTAGPVGQEWGLPP